MGQRRIAIIAVVLFVAAVVVWWSRRDRTSDTPGTPAATQAGSGPVIVASAPSPAQTASIEVRVSDAHGPIAGASVRIASDQGDLVTANTNGSGVAVAKLQPGLYSVSASAIDHLPAALPGHPLSAGEDAKLAITLALGGVTLAGVVTDVSGGPIGGVRIDAATLGSAARPSAAIATTSTGGDGRYRLTVAEGPALVAARSADYAPQSRYVTIGPSGGTADFALVPGGVIEGVVLDAASKQPVPGAAIVARRDSPAMLLAEAGGHRVVANADGRFRLTGLRPGVYELDARGDHRRSKSPTVIGLGVAEQLTDVRILVGAGAVVRGKVVDESDAPVAEASVFSLGRDAEATSDSKGAFALDGLPAGKYALLARTATHVSSGIASIEVADKDLDGVVIRVRRGQTIKGHVEPRQVAEVRLEVDETGVPLPSFVAPVTTTADGAFELGPVLPGKGRLSAHCPSGDQGGLEIAIAPGMAEIVLNVVAGASIAGRVTDGDNKPVPGVTVMAASDGPTERVTIVNGMVTSGIQAVTGPNGAYVVNGLAAGGYRMSVLDRGRPLRTRKTPPSPKLAAGENKTGVDLAVDRPNGVIKGVVTGPDGAPLADAWVSVHEDLGAMLERGTGARPEKAGEGDSRMVTIEATDEGDANGDAGSVQPALSDAQGRFEITGLVHTKYEVVAEAKAGTLRARVAAVTPDATLSLKLLGVTSLSGTVRGPRGPATLFEVELDGPTHAHRSFADGTFELRVDPGAYVVRVTSSEGNGEVKLVVAPNTPAKVDITLVANAVVTGVLVDADNKPVAGVAVVVIDDTGDARVSVSIDGPPTTSAHDGTFRIEHKAGAGVLVVMKPPRPIIKKGLVLESGKTLDVGVVRVVSQPPPPD